MDFEFLGSIGWRDIVLVVAAMIGIYLVLSVMRLFQVAGKRRHGTQAGGKGRFSGWEPYASQQEKAVQPLAPEMLSDFAEQLARSNVEVELQSLRRESADLREELVRLAEEIARLKATRHVSPTYNEAMTLAQQGVPAAGIAGHCGISIGEAELVAALARSGTEFERQEQGEVRDERNTDYGNRPHG
jgi:hypothetical protein